jgi:hypothetical protein
VSCPCWLAARSMNKSADLTPKENLPQVFRKLTLD